VDLKKKPETEQKTWYMPKVAVAPDGVKIQYSVSSELLWGGPEGWEKF